PSVNMARSIWSWPFFLLVFSIDSNWSSKIDFESNSKRPIKVLFPSSTLPHVVKRRSVLLFIFMVMRIFMRIDANYGELTRIIANQSYLIFFYRLRKVLQS